MNEAVIALSRRLAVWTGLDLERGVHAHILHDVLSRRATAMGTTIDAYASALQAAHSPEAMRIIDFVTVCHSWFFRDREQLSGVERLIVDAASELNIWLAGCASGEEAYTIAMLADARGRRPYILGTDINTEALARARAGRYGPWSLKDLPTAYADRFSRRADATCELVPRVRLAVELLRHNLMEAPPAPRSPRGWDVILCRNVLMYFRPVDAAATITRLRNALRPGGYLVLGASDILAEAPHGMRFVALGGRYVLQRSLDDQPERPRRLATEPGWSPPPTQNAAAITSARVTATQTPPRIIVPVITAPVDDALARGVSAFDAGNFTEAISQFSTAMDRDPLSPEAAVFSGIACFLLGDATSALVDLRRALVLDPELWQAELYLAMSHERLGYTSEATAAYQRLCALLTRPPRRKVSGVMTQLEAWRDEALTLARHKTRRSIPGA